MKKYETFITVYCNYVHNSVCVHTTQSCCIFFQSRLQHRKLHITKCRRHTMLCRPLYRQRFGLLRLPIISVQIAKETACLVVLALLVAVRSVVGLELTQQCVTREQASKQASPLTDNGRIALLAHQPVTAVMSPCYDGMGDFFDSWF